MKKGCEFHNDCFTCSYPAEWGCSPTRIRKFLLEQGMIELRAKNESNKEIAKAVGRGVRTVERHIGV